MTVHNQGVPGFEWNSEDSWLEDEMNYWSEAAIEARKALAREHAVKRGLNKEETDELIARYALG